MRWAVILIALSGCPVPGERAGSNGDEDNCWFDDDCDQPTTCPVGEICSPQTPQGLSFSAAGLGELFQGGGPETVAVGGTQSIRLIDERTNASLSLRYSAQVASPLEVVETSGATVVLGATGGGSAYLRILEPDGVHLHDRIMLSALPIVRVDLGALVSLLDADGDEKGHVVLAGVAVEAILRLHGAGDVRLVDESTALLAGATSTGRWDHLAIPASPAGPHPIQARTGGQIRDLVVDVVAAADDVAFARSLFAPTGVWPVLRVGGETTLCFRATSGERSVLGASFGFSSPTLALEPDATLPCLNVTARTAGPHALTVSAAGASRTFYLQTAASAKPAAVRLPEPSGARHGERAASR